MAERGISTPNSHVDLRELLGFGAGSHASGFAPGLDAPPAEPEISVAGVMLLTAFSVAMAFLGVVFLALLLLAAWWVMVHIPVPPFVVHLLAKLGFA